MAIVVLWELRLDTRCLLQMLGTKLNTHAYWKDHQHDRKNYSFCKQKNNKAEEWQMLLINPELQFNAWDKDLFFQVKIPNSCSFLLLHNLAVHTSGI